jgi:hypothetical protein
LRLCPLLNVPQANGFLILRQTPLWHNEKLPLLGITMISFPHLGYRVPRENINASIPLCVTARTPRRSDIEGGTLSSRIALAASLASG